MICWIESVDPVPDLCLTNQIYSVLLNTFELKEITEVQNAHLKCFSKIAKRELVDVARRRRSWKVTKRDLVVASTRHHRVGLLKYYPRQPCASSFVKSRMLRKTTDTFLIFSTNRLYPCMYVYTRRILGCLLGFCPLGKTLQGQILCRKKV